MSCLNSRPCAGYTLIELVTTFAVLSVVLSTAVPGFSTLLERNARTGAINQFSTSLALARAEAVKRYRRVTLCPSTDQLSCTGGFAWHEGYIVFVDDNADGEHDVDESLLALADNQSASLRILSSTGRRKITYRPSGMTPGSNTTVRFCDNDKDPNGKALIIANSGRPRLSDSMPDGSAISCI
ncbi:MAG: GspH/FimT family pseudopilin [Chromatiales bacterium]